MVSMVSVLLVVKLPAELPRVEFGLLYRENSHTILDPSYLKGVVNVRVSQFDVLAAAVLNSANEMKVSSRCKVMF
jgi:hypothetical protein